MKKIIFYSLLGVLALSSCKKDIAPAFDQSPDERINAKLAYYQSLLADSATHGWIGLVYPTGLGGEIPFAFYFKFNDSNRVQMFSDFDSLSNVTMKESSYRLKSLDQPSLLFDTYNYLHVLADPDASKNGGTYGEGLSSDFEFALDSVKGDSIMLRGRMHSTRAVFIRATAQQEADYYAKKNTMIFDKITKYLKYFRRFTLDGATYEINYIPNRKLVIMTWIDANGASHTQSTNYYYTSDGISFTQPITDGTVTIAGFTSTTWNASSLSMTFVVNGTKVSVVEAIKPLVTDVAAPKRWWNTAESAGSYWYTYYGFHVDGVDDADGFANVGNYYFFGFWPKGTLSNLSYDLGGFVIYQSDGSASIDYGPAFKTPTYTSDGRMIFNIAGILGTPPDADTTTVYNTTDRFLDSKGFYFVQTGESIYDMVGATNAQQWINWQR